MPPILPILTVSRDTNFGALQALVSPDLECCFTGRAQPRTECAPSTSTSPSRPPTGWSQNTSTRRAELGLSSPDIAEHEVRNYVPA